MSAWQRQLTVPQFTVVSGLLVIALGTLLLATPLKVSHLMPAARKRADGGSE